MGFNSQVLDVEPQQPEEYAIPDGEEEQIKALVDGKVTNSAGGMFKIGMLVVNSRVMLKSNEKLDEIKKEADEKRQQKTKEKVEKTEQAAIVAFCQWIDRGRRVDANGYPALSKDGSVAIVKVLLPRIAPDEKVADYSTMKACIKWLGTLARGTTWEDEMKAVEEERNLVQSQRQETPQERPPGQ